MATPVHYIAEMSNVRLPQDGMLALSMASAETLAADFNRVWQGSGISLWAARSAQLLCIFDRPLTVSTRDPQDVLGLHIEEFLPTGADSKRLRQLISETEMWLFEHPANQARRELGQPAVNGLWFWGGGTPLSSLPKVQGWAAGDDVFFNAVGRPRDEHIASGVIAAGSGPGSSGWHQAESWLEAAAAAAPSRPHIAIADLCRRSVLYGDGARPQAVLASAQTVVGVVRLSTIEVRRRNALVSGDFAAHLHPVLRRVYAARGIGRDSELDLSLDQLLPVGSLEGLDAATSLLAAHRATGRVLVIGDFDADGATSTAVVLRALRAMRFAHVDFLVPDRFRFGYGLTPEIVAQAKTRAPTLIVTVDNGVSSIAGVEAARAMGVPVLVTDHHLPGAVLPRAEVIVNPNLPGGRFASGALAGVGVAFYLVAALARALGEERFRAADLLDLVALGTVADMVPLDRNNRILVSQGLKRIRAGRCVAGIRALLESAGRNPEQLTAADLGFAVAPRLNAAGRLADMSVGIECLLTDDVEKAAHLAGLLATAQR